MRIQREYKNEKKIHQTNKTLKTKNISGKCITFNKICNKIFQYNNHN